MGFDASLIRWHGDNYALLYSPKDAANLVMWLKARGDASAFVGSHSGGNDRNHTPCVWVRPDLRRVLQGEAAARLAEQASA
jgi:hypothetical protein